MIKEEKREIKKEPEKNEEKPKQEEKISLKEERIRKIALLYYSRGDIRKNMLEFSKNRECVPRYFEGFGKRPDAFQYESDILNYAKKGATSFHCSEELWRDPLEIATGMSDKDLKSLRAGWDLLIDIDCKYLEFSKKAAYSIIQALRASGVNNVGLKFSVTGDTPVLIQTPKETKLMPIKEAIDLFKNEENISILSLGLDKHTKFSKVYDYLEHKDDVYNILYENSKVPIKTTAHHSVFIFEDGEIIQKKVSELSKNNFLITFNSKKNPIEKDLCFIKNSFSLASNQFDAKILTNNVKITPDLMRLLGYYLAEGHVTNVINQVGFSFNRKEEEYIKDCVSLLKKITKRKISLRHPNIHSTQILIHSKEWASFFENYCGKSKGKHLPQFSWNLSKSLFLEMLKGYLRGDGYKVGEYELVAKSVALRLVKELVWLCKLNGISCSLSTEKNKPHLLPQGSFFKGSFVYIISIPKSEIQIPEFTRSRNKFSPMPRERTFPIYGLKKVYKQIKPKKFLSHRVEQVTLRKERANLERIKKVIIWFKEHKSIDFSKESERIIRNYESLFNSDVGIIKVRDISHIGKEMVFDVSVDETESFFGGEYPILLHNSGGKGFHIIVPWKAFPIELSGKKTSDMFPEWPRRICAYLKEKSQPFLEKEISTEDTKSMSGFNKGMICETCKNISEEKEKILYICHGCKTEIENLTDTFKRKRIIRCPKCEKEMLESSRSKFFLCRTCNKNSKTHPGNFIAEKVDVFQILGLDVILVSPRHLFRMPYSLHEKTALASVVISPEQLTNFDMLKDADPMRIIPKNFIPDSEENEAKRLLIEALEFKLPEENAVITKAYKEIEREFNKDGSEKKVFKNNNLGGKSQTDSDNKFAEVDYSRVREEHYPPTIQKILKGMGDGRKRALFILLSFFKSLRMSDEQIQSKIDEWNKKNSEPLNPSYIRGQLGWYSKSKEIKLPPNFDKPYYKEIGIAPAEEELKAKNPLSYAVRKSFGSNFKKKDKK